MWLRSDNRYSCHAVNLIFDLHWRLMKMKGTFLKLLAGALTGLFLVSVGAAPQTEQECTQAGGVWDAGTGTCAMPEGK